MADLKEKGCALLSTTTVTFAADGDTQLYTVPTGKRCVLSHAIIVAAADCGTTDISIGANGAETDFVNAVTLSAIDAQYDACIVCPVPADPVAKIESYAAGTVIEIKVASHAGAAGNTVYLFGFLY